MSLKLYGDAVEAYRETLRTQLRTRTRGISWEWIRIEGLSSRMREVYQALRSLPAREQSCISILIFCLECCGYDKESDIPCRLHIFLQIALLAIGHKNLSAFRKQEQPVSSFAFPPERHMCDNSAHS